MSSQWDDYRTYLPLWIGLYRWSMFFILRVIPCLFYRVKKAPKQDGTNDEHTEHTEQQRIPYTKDDVTAVIPVYEPPETFTQTIESLIGNGVKQILVVADTTCLETMRECCAPYAEVSVIEETRPGKRCAMATGLSQVKTRITAFVDDDVQWCDTALEYLINPFNHSEKFKGVGCEHRARKSHAFDIGMILADMRLSVRMLELFAESVVDKGASCISGRTACYLTEFIQEDEFYDYFLNERFCTLQLISGDDKFITRYVMNKGGKIWHQGGSKCNLTTSFERGLPFLRQLLRWSRNTWRSDIVNLFCERKIWRHNPFTAIVLADKMVTPFFLMYGFFYVPIDAIIRQDYVLFVGWVIWLLASRMIRLAYYFVLHPWHVIFVPFWVGFQYLQAVLRLVALVSLCHRGWGTRAIFADGNKITRVEPMAAPSCVMCTRPGVKHEEEPVE